FTIWSVLELVNRDTRPESVSRRLKRVLVGADMGRQIFVAFSYDDEQNLVDELVKDGFAVVPERLPTPRIWEHAWSTLPPDDQAESWLYPSAILPGILARKRQACFVGIPSPLGKRPRGSIPIRLVYSVNTRCLPS